MTTNDGVVDTQPAARTSSTSIDDAPLNGFHKRLALYSSGGPFLDGYILSIIGIALVQIGPEMSVSALWSGLLGASALIGLFVGGAVFGPITDRVGRKVMYTIDLVAIIVLSVAQFFVADVATLFVLRLLIGVAVGADYPIATALMAEFAPRAWRARLVGGLNAMWFVGATVAAFVGYALLQVPGGWRWMLLSSALPALAIVLARLGMPESPRWLAGRGRTEEALRILRETVGPDATLDDLEPQQESGATVRDLFRGGYLRRIVFISIFWTATVVPLFALYAFGPRVLGLFGLDGGDQANLGSGVINVMFLVGNVVALLLVDRLGRRPVLIGGFVVSGLGLLYLAVAPHSSVWLIAGAFALYAVFNGGPSILEWIYPNELFPTRIRATAVGLCTGISRVGAAVGTFATPWALESLGLAGTMYVAAAIALVGGLASWLMAPETAHHDLHRTSAVTGRASRRGGS